MAAAPVFVLLGHGKDVCDAATHKPIRQDLPAGVVLVQSAMCSMPVERGVMLNKILPNLTNPANLAIVQQADPAAVSAMIGSVAVHRSTAADPLTKTIVKSHLVFMLDWEFRDRVEFLPSGVIRLPLAAPLDTTSLVWPKSQPGLPVGSFLELYRHSVFPTMAMMRERLQTLNVVDNMTWADYKRIKDDLSMKDDFLTLATRSPGIYYHPVCRVVDPSCLQETMAVRSASGAASGRSAADIEEAVRKNAVTLFKAGLSDRAAIEGASLSIEKFMLVFNDILRFVIEKNENICDTDSVFSLQIYLMNVIRKSTTPEKYRQVFSMITAKCNPGISDAQASAHFDLVVAGLGAIRDPVVERAPSEPLATGMRVRITNSSKPGAQIGRYIITSSEPVMKGPAGAQVLAWQVTPVPGSVDMAPRFVAAANLVPAPVDASGAELQRAELGGRRRRRKTRRRHRKARRTRKAF